MPDKNIKLRELLKIMRSFDVEWDSKRGKGSHGILQKMVDGKKTVYPLPTSKKQISKWYVREARKKFKLTAEDGISDKQFYSE